MKSVFKYNLVGCLALMPRGAQVLSVANQHESVVVWALVDTTAELVQREFKVVCTGDTVKPAELGKFIGTVLLRGGAFVLHVFDDPGPRTVVGL